ncbi:MAG: hypothetical protein ACD_50C00370G0001, partial [uncultured bacterium]
MKKILVSTSSFNLAQNSDVSRLTSQGFEVISNPYNRRLSEAEAREMLKSGIVGLIAGVERLSREILTSAQNLQVISRCGIGLDSVDLTAAAEKGILVFNTPDAPRMSVAELTLALILNILRRVGEADRNIR